MQRKPKVMLVDDEDSIRRVVEQIITNDGYEFYYAPNGKKALAMFKELNPSLLIIDVMLPELNGFELCRLIREESMVPIIILSAKSDIVDKSVGYTMGADDYISKPFSPEELSLKIKALLRRSAQFDSTRASKLNKIRMFIASVIWKSITNVMKSRSAAAKLT